VVCLSCRQLCPRVKLAGPTSFGPAIRRACQVVADSGGRYHILLLIADGQVKCCCQYHVCLLLGLYCHCVACTPPVH